MHINSSWSDLCSEKSASLYIHSYNISVCVCLWMCVWFAFVCVCVLTLNKCIKPIKENNITKKEKNKTLFTQYKFVNMVYHSDFLWKFICILLL